MKPDNVPCAHAYVTSDAICLHCNADASDQVDEAVTRLNHAIQQTLGANPDQQHVLQQTSAAAVHP